MKRTRYCGEVKIELEYLGYYENRDRFFCQVIVAKYVWQYDKIFTEPQPQSIEEIFDEAASGAIHFGSKYNLGWDLDDGCIPDWAPPRDIAQAINDAISVDHIGFIISREQPGK